MIAAGSIAKTIGEMKKASKKRNFLQSVELAINLRGLDMTKPENRLNEEFLLPKGRGGKEVKVAVIAGGEMATQAKKVADKVIKKSELERLAKNKKEAKGLAKGYEFFIAQAELMPLVGRTLGPVLGPRGKMPKPLPGNADIATIVKRLKKTVRVMTKEKPVFHVVIGTEDMKEEDLKENADAVLRFLERKLVGGASNIKSVYMKTTMGQSVKIEG